MQDVITINVQPGWKDGTRITFAGKGDELPGQPAQVYTLSLLSRTLRHSHPMTQHVRCHVFTECSVQRNVEVHAVIFKAPQD